MLLSLRPQIINACVDWATGATAADRKVPALKTLQGHIWRSGFQRGELRSELYRDVPDALTEWRGQGIKTYVYSSGSREAQKLFFGHSQVRATLAPCSTPIIIISSSGGGGIGGKLPTELYRKKAVLWQAPGHHQMPPTCSAECRLLAHLISSTGPSFSALSSLPCRLSQVGELRPYLYGFFKHYLRSQHQGALITLLPCRLSQVGDLRPYLYGFFDTTSGPKTEEHSYRDIQLALGVDSPSEILFATDAILEAEAAHQAGWRAVLVERPGNKQLPAAPGFRVIDSMQQLLS